MDQITLKARAEVNRGQKVLAFTPEHIENPNRHGERWQDAPLSLSSGKRLEFTAADAEFLRNFEPGKAYRIVITEAEDQ